MELKLELGGMDAQLLAYSWDSYRDYMKSRWGIDTIEGYALHLMKRGLEEVDALGLEREDRSWLGPQ